ncbi:hypothetical protein CBR_g45285 [Chara braunii]|uniref:GPI inositol-deacylase n=1 Tax=Chara braunii TaxID=69332 RepID=A0A388LY39_CHABU|nr:hypothetical protein CBR_g45285 [Chara braunii]|eukprot:GBG87226.1 hypothetical protein CBR_g45285 [Chara braunii]
MSSKWALGEVEQISRECQSHDSPSSTLKTAEGGDGSRECEEAPLSAASNPESSVSTASTSNSRNGSWGAINSEAGYAEASPATPEPPVSPTQTSSVSTSSRSNSHTGSWSAIKSESAYAEASAATPEPSLTPNQTSVATELLAAADAKQLTSTDCPKPSLSSNAKGKIGSSTKEAVAGLFDPSKAFSTVFRSGRRSASPATVGTGSGRNSRGPGLSGWVDRLLSHIHTALRGSHDDIGWLRREPGLPAIIDRTGRFNQLNARIYHGIHTLPDNLVYLLVPGLFSSLGALSFLDAKRYLMTLGLSCYVMPIRCEASVESNAYQIKEYIEDLHWGINHKKVVILGHGKGAVDSAAALAVYSADLKGKVAGLVSMQAPYGGSPVASGLLKKGRPLDDESQALIRTVLGEICGGDIRVMQDLTYEKRRKFLAKHPLPADLPNVSFHTEITGLTGQGGSTDISPLSPAYNGKSHFSPPGSGKVHTPAEGSDPLQSPSSPSRASSPVTTTLTLPPPISEATSGHDFCPPDDNNHGSNPSGSTPSAEPGPKTEPGSATEPGSKTEASPAGEPGSTTGPGCGPDAGSATEPGSTAGPDAAPGTGSGTELGFETEPVPLTLAIALKALANHLHLRYGVKSDGFVVCEDAEIPGSIVVRSAVKVDHAGTVYSEIHDSSEKQLPATVYPKNFVDGPQMIEALLTLLLESAGDVWKEPGMTLEQENRSRRQKTAKRENATGDDGRRNANKEAPCGGGSRGEKHSAKNAKNSKTLIDFGYSTEATPTPSEDPGSGYPDCCRRESFASGQKPDTEQSIWFGWESSRENCTNSESGRLQQTGNKEFQTPTGDPGATQRQKDVFRKQLDGLRNSRESDGSEMFELDFDWDDRKERLSRYSENAALCRESDARVDAIAAECPYLWQISTMDDGRDAVADWTTDWEEVSLGGKERKVEDADMESIVSISREERNNCASIPHNTVSCSNPFLICCQAMTVSPSISTAPESPAWKEPGSSTIDHHADSGSGLEPSLGLVHPGPVVDPGSKLPSLFNERPQAAGIDRQELLATQQPHPGMDPGTDGAPGTTASTVPNASADNLSAVCGLSESPYSTAVDVPAESVVEAAGGSAQPDATSAAAATTGTREPDKAAQFLVHAETIDIADHSSRSPAAAAAAAVARAGGGGGGGGGGGCGVGGDGSVAPTSRNESKNNTGCMQGGDGAVVADSATEFYDPAQFWSLATSPLSRTPAPEAALCEGGCSQPWVDTEDENQDPHHTDEARSGPQRSLKQEVLNQQLIYRLHHMRPARSVFTGLHEGRHRGAGGSGVKLVTITENSKEPRPTPVSDLSAANSEDGRDSPLTSSFTLSTSRLSLSDDLRSVEDPSNFCVCGSCTGEPPGEELASPQCSPSIMHHILRGVK